jgi:hypothetical protein
VALRRESDYQTGLSFTVTPPTEGPCFVYGVGTLEKEGYTVEVDGGKQVISRWDPGWVVHDHDGQIRIYAEDHASVYHEHGYWRAWYEAELQVNGDGSSDFSQRFYDLALEYREG